MEKIKEVYRINEEDGPTSVFVIKKNKKRNIRQRWQKFINELKKRKIAKTISGGYYHSMQEVIEYAIKEYELSEVDKENAEFLEEYRQLRASFMLQYQPELLGEHAKISVPNYENPEVVMTYIEKCKERVQYAMDIPKELFDIDMHKLTKKYSDTNDSLDVIIETKYGYIGGSAVGDKAVKKLNEIMVCLYRYYGVTQEDIDNQTERYKNLIKELCSYGK